LSGDAGGEIEAKMERVREREKESSGFIFDLLHSSGRRRGTLHLISHTLIRPDLGSQHDETPVNLRATETPV